MTPRADPRFLQACSDVVDALREVVTAVEQIDVPAKRRTSSRKPLPKFNIATLSDVEQAVHAYLRQHRGLLDTVAPRQEGSRQWRRDIDCVDRGILLPYLRAAIAVNDIVQLATIPARNVLGAGWGTHLFNRDDVALVDFAPLELRGLSPLAAEVLLPEVCADLVDAVRDIVTEGPVALGPAFDPIRAGIDRACQALVDQPVGRELRLGPGSLWTGQRIGEELHMTDAEVADLADKRKLLRLQTWDGRVRYPSFQVVGGVVHPLVSELLPDIVRAFTSWPLAFWLNERIDRRDAIDAVKEELRELNAWLPDRAGTADRYALVPPEPAAESVVGGWLHRVGQRGNEPFFFATVDTASPPAPKATRPVDGGRWDLPADSRSGTMYLSEQPEGAWAETLDRLPVVTLSDVVGRTMWRLRPKDSVTVMDLTGARIPADIWIERQRPRTQAIAARARLRGAKGMRVRLRSSPAGLGVALFGPAGSTPPSVARLGHWRIESSPAELDDALWRYIRERPTAQALSSYLRRFPGEVSLAS